MYHSEIRSVTINDFNKIIERYGVDFISDIVKKNIHYFKTKNKYDTVNVIIRNRHTGEFSINVKFYEKSFIVEEDIDILRINNDLSISTSGNIKIIWSWKWSPFELGEEILKELNIMRRSLKIDNILKS